MFIDALTVGGPGGNPKPIEMHAHDPKRYIGDMFAWLHQAIPNEKENLMILVKKCDKNGTKAILNCPQFPFNSYFQIYPTKSKLLWPTLPMVFAIL